MGNFRYEKLWVISDIHGYYEKVVQLLQKIGILDRQGEIKSQESVKVIFLGDFIDRGDKPLETLNLIMSLVKSGKALAITGNHDSWYIRYNKGSNVMMNQEREKTLADIEASALYSPSLLNEIQDFLNELPVFLEIDGMVFVHAAFSRTLSKKDKKKQSFMMYGPTTGRTLDSGLPERVEWYKDYDGRYGKVFFGHYSLSDKVSEFSNCVSVDCGVFKTGILGAYEVTTGEKEYV